MKPKMHSYLIKPLTLVLDLLIIVCVVFVMNFKEYLNVTFLMFILSFWSVISFYTGFYNIYRYTHLVQVLKKLTTQFAVFILAYFSYFSIFQEGIVIKEQSTFLIYIISLIVFFKFLGFYLLKTYRLRGNNYRNVIVMGSNSTAKSIVKTFKESPDLGYRFFGFFSDKKNISENYLGMINEGFEYVLTNNIEEIYCDISELKQKQIKQIRIFTSENNIKLRLIPEFKSTYSRGFSVDYYGVVPVLTPKPLPLDKIETLFLKRVFDVLFSLFVVIFVLSWLLPILWIIVKLNSKGNFFFIQKREGINGKPFNCLKIRTMEKNNSSETQHTVKEDTRITKIGFFLRKTSLDELPQFINVLKGDMSVVGPRPHMSNQSLKFEEEVKNYMRRKIVRPGITGLAQISGYRGEVKKKSDIENRVRFDIFYIENWSIFLDIKIIIQTVLNVFKGEEKAY